MWREMICLISLVLVMGLALTTPADAELVGWWRLNEGTRYTFADLSGYGHNGTIDPPNESKVKWAVEGYKGSALQFLTAISPYTFCDAPLTPGLLNIAESTYSFWMKTPAATYQPWGPALVLIGEQHDSDFELTDTGLPFIMGEPNTGGVVGYIGDWSMASGVALNDDKWHHITVTCSASNQRIIFYLDGEMEVTSDPNWGISDNILTVRLGGPRSSDARRQWRNYIGTLDEVAVFNHPLTADEVVSLFKYGPKPTPLATTPFPPENAEDVSRNVTLKWEPGIYANKHNVYLGTVSEDVNKASVNDSRGVLLKQNHDGVTLPAGLLDFGRTYYWRIEEVNELHPDSPWGGDVWSFTSANFMVVDDFESYTDLAPGRIFDKWKDGWGTQTNGSMVGYSDPNFNIGEHFVESGIVHSGLQSMPFFYDNNNKYSEAVIALSSSDSDWTRNGVEFLTIWFKGYPGKASGFVEDPAGTYTLKGLGGDIWADLDQFLFVYKELSGAGTIAVKVETVENIDPFAKAGVMIRDSLEPDSAYASVLITPENGIRFQYRLVAGGNTDREFDPNIAAPYWVKLQRTAGGLIRASCSPDNTTWKQFTLKTITMKMPIYIGLAVTSHDVEKLCEAKFSNVSFPGMTSAIVSAPWTEGDVGINTNNADSMYVILNGSAIVYHDDPNATQKNAWTEWNIPLQKFVSQGVNLSRVGSFGIGFGNRSNPQPGGKGTMYIDDIRLYLPDPAK